MAIPLHLGVHLLGLAVAAGLVVLATVGPAGRAPAITRPARWGIVLGGILLAGSHLAVGGLFAEADGWPLLLRAAGYAALAVGAAGGLLTSVAVVVVLPPLAALAAGLAGVAAAIAAARGVLGRGWAVAPLVAGISLWALGDLAAGMEPGIVPEAAAGLSIAGSLAVGWWVVRRAAASALAGRITGAYLGVLLVLVVGLGSASGQVLTSDVRSEQVERLAAVARAQAVDLVDRAGATLEATASALAGATIVMPLEAGDHEQAARAAARITALPDIDIVVLTDAAGGVVGATDREGTLPTVTGLAVAGAPAVEAALDGAVARGVVDLGDGDLAVIGAVPVAPTGEDGRPLPLRQVGSLVLGRLLTTPAVVERVAADTASDVAVVVGGDVVASTLEREAWADIGAGPGNGTTEVAGEPRALATAPLGEPALGEPARGELVLALAPSVVADAADTALRTSFLLAAAGLLAAGLLATLLARRIADPVTRLTNAAERVRAGDLDTRVEVERDDEVGRLAAAFDDMTATLEARDHALRSSLTTQAALRDRMEAVTASMGEALLATDASGVVITANPAAGELLARPAEQLVGRPLADVLHGRTDAGASLAAALTDTAAVPHLRGELAGAGRVVEATAGPLVLDTEAVDGARDSVGRVIVVRDITERVLAERVRTEVIANLSHELNTPLTPIKAFLEVAAARGAVNARFKPMLELARDGQARLERTITALVDLAELEAGKKQVSVRTVPVSSMIDAALERWRPALPDRRLTRRVRRGLPPVRTDAATAGRILDELLDNARKFGVGPVRVLADLAGDEVRITVRDDGPGIADDRRAEVLELFVQADGSSTRAIGGLGIGLPIATRLAALVGGRLELGRPPQGTGLDVTLVLPAAGEERP